MSVIPEISYNFFKTTFSSYNVEGYGLLHDCKLFELYDADSYIGQLFIHRKICFINYSKNDFKIEIKRYFLKKSSYIIINKATANRVGEYYIPNWTGGGLGKVGSIAVGYETYECEMVLPDIRAKLFKKSTWGHHKMILANDITDVAYHCQEGKGADAFAKRDMFPLTGTIAAYNAEVFLILSGFYMLEQGMLREDMVAT